METYVITSWPFTVNKRATTSWNQPPLVVYEVYNSIKFLNYFLKSHKILVVNKVIENGQYSVASFHFE